MSALLDETTLALTKTDEKGRRQLAPLSGFQWLGTLTAGGLEYREVPEEHWTAPGEGTSVAVVSCLCGQEARVPVAAYPTPCACGRWFFYAGTVVLSLIVSRPAAG